MRAALKRFGDHGGPFRTVRIAAVACLWLSVAPPLPADPAGGVSLTATRRATDLRRLPIPNREDLARRILSESERVNVESPTNGERPAVVDFPTAKPIQDIQLSIGENDEVTPTDFADQWLQELSSIHAVTGISRDCPASSYCWMAPSIGYRPLYFEEVNLERYGHSCGIFQPALSTAHFFGNVIALPYHAVATPPFECIYSLGYERPGNCAPCYRRRLSSISIRGSAAQVAAVGGLILLVP